MHRPGFSNPAPAHSPPLHHPVPQHVSTVPQLRSPPPPQAQQQPQPQQYNYGYNTQQAGSAYSHPAFGGLMNDPTTQMGLQLGKNAFDIGHNYAEQSVRSHD